MSKLSRRQFIATTSAAAVVTGVAQAKGITYPFDSVRTEAKLSPFNDGFAPPTKQPGTNLSLYAHISPNIYDEYASVSWEVSTDSKFNNIVLADSTQFFMDVDTIMSVNMEGIPPGSQLFYRFTCENCYLNRTSDQLDAEILEVLETTGQRIRNYSKELDVKLQGEFLAMFRKQTAVSDQSAYV